MPYGEWTFIKQMRIRPTNTQSLSVHSPLLFDCAASKVSWMSKKNHVFNLCFIRFFFILFQFQFFPFHIRSTFPFIYVCAVDPVKHKFSNESKLFLIHPLSIRVERRIKKNTNRKIEVCNHNIHAHFRPTQTTAK